MKNILLPTDFSENAWNATKYAIELFKEEPCVFHLLNTYTPAIIHSRFMAVATGGRQLEDVVRCDSENGLQLVLQRISEVCPNPNHSFQVISSFNMLTEEIRDSVESLAIDLVVTGTKGASGMKEVFLGSNTVRIIKAAISCPVLAVPDNYEYTKPLEIAFVTDFKRSFNAEILEPLRNLANYLGASVRIMNIREEKQLDKYQVSNRNILGEYLADLKISWHWMPPFSTKSNVIKHFLEEFEIDMLVMVNNRHGFLDELMRESVIKRVAFHTRIPLLVLAE